jgi:6-pyruvoyltetrahydropterin/6-carboxytetrahydropterin synthase
MYASTKTYGHDVGLSVCFRQWHADSHCSFFHGYSIAVKLTFEAVTLDKRNWVMDFGALKPVKEWLQLKFDHKMLVAYDDPALHFIKQLYGCKAADIVYVQNVGCEAFAEMIYDFVDWWLKNNNHAPRVALRKVEVKEHGANSAIYEG